MENSTFPPSVAIEKQTLYNCAILIQYAIDFQYCDLTTTLSSSNRECYRLRKKFHSLFIFAALGLLLVHFFAKPYWSNGVENWDSLNIYPATGISVLPNTAAIILNSIFAIIIQYALYLEFNVVQSSWRLAVLYVLNILLFVKGNSLFN
jgi:hypothetical protein